LIAEEGWESSIFVYLLIALGALLLFFCLCNCYQKTFVEAKHSTQYGAEDKLYEEYDEGHSSQKKNKKGKDLQKKIQSPRFEPLNPVPFKLSPRSAGSSHADSKIDERGEDLIKSKQTSDHKFRFLPNLIKRP